MKQEELNQLIAVLKSTPEKVSVMAEGVGENNLRKKEFEEEFSILEHVCHLRDIEREGYCERIRKILNEIEPLLEDIDGGRLAVEREYNRQDLSAALKDFAASRRSSIDYLEGIDLSELARRAHFEGAGQITLERLLLMMREHDEEHLATIRRLCSSSNGVESIKR